MMAAQNQLSIPRENAEEYPREEIQNHSEPCGSSEALRAA
jgi:hypothetical protein